MFALIKEYLIYILGVATLLLFFCTRCNVPVRKDSVVVPTGVSSKELQEIKKQIPEAQKAVKFIPPVASLGKTTESTIVVKKDGEIVVINKQVSRIGFKRDLGVWIGGLTQLDGGLSLDFLEYDRFNLGLLAGVKSSGICLNYQVWNNTSAGIAYNYNYSLVPSPIVFLKLSF